MAYLPGTERGYITTRALRNRHKHARHRAALILCPVGSRIAIPKQNVPTWPNSTYLFSPMPILWTRADAHAFNCWSAGNRDYVRIRNTSPSESRTVIVRTVPDPIFNRLGDRLVVVPANSDVEFGPVPRLGYMQGDGNIWIDAPCSDVLLAVVTFS